MPATLCQRDMKNIERTLGGSTGHCIGLRRPSATSGRPFGSSVGFGYCLMSDGSIGFGLKPGVDIGDAEPTVPLAEKKC